jgi:chemotaxis signal transduction protein
MSDVPEWLLLFQTGSLRFGFDVDAVDRVIPALEVNPLPGAPMSVRGVTVVSDEIVPVIDPTTPFKNGDALRFGQAGSLMERAPELKGISVGADGLVYVSDIERLISDADEIQLQAALADCSHDGP